MAVKKTSLKFPPSRLEIVLACPGSFALEKNVVYSGDFKPRPYADEGKAAHTLAEQVLKDGSFDTSFFLGKMIKVDNGKKGSVDIQATLEMCESVQIYVDAVKARMDAFKSRKSVKNVTLVVEKRVDTSSVIGQPDQHGSIDTMILVENTNGTASLFVEDLKYGKGVPVTAKDNTQLMTYAAALLDSKMAHVKDVTLVIHMPRLGYVDKWNVSATALKQFKKDVKKGVNAAIKQEEILKTKGVDALTLKPGEKQCRFCRAKPLCPAFNKAGKKPKPANGNAPATKPKSRRQKQP